MVHSGIYIHIPYCKRKCTYCNFHFSTQFDTVPVLLEALHKEILLRRQEIPDIVVDTIYFGGGTPSVFSASQIESLLHAVYSNYPVSLGAEITMECNPDDLSRQYLQDLHSIGINRLSMGIQSFSDRDLQWMNRAHNAIQSKQALTLAAWTGFDNISCDLIFGIPGASDEEWLQHLSILYDFGVPHISCYALTVEEKTLLEHRIRHKLMPALSEEDSARQMILLFDTMTRHGYEAYEISNYCLPGQRAVHNSNYWKGLPYLGFGPSAHSYNGNKRRWNISNNQRYADAVNSGKLYYESETLTRRDRFNEFLMINLRRIEGIRIAELQQNFMEYASDTLLELNRLQGEGLIAVNAEAYTLSKEGRLLSDSVIRNLFQV